MRALSSAAGLVLLMTFGQPATARADFPDRPIKIVVPFAPGGGNDIMARLVADSMTKELGVSVIVENKAGAGTIVGTEAVSRSAPDGYTLLLASSTFAIMPSMHAKLPYDTAMDFAPVALIARSFHLVVVNPRLPFKSVQDVIAYAKANPGKLNFGSPGIGTTIHLAGELFKSLAHIEMTHVPYKGSALAISDLLSGQLQIMFPTVPPAATFVQSGMLRALAVTSAQRSPAFPELPTVAEAGLADYVGEIWYGLFAPAGTPSEIRLQLNASVAKAIGSGAFKSIEANEGLTFAPGTPEEFGRYVSGDTAHWHEIVRDARVQVQ